MTEGCQDDSPRGQRDGLSPCLRPSSGSARGGVGSTKETYPNLVDTRSEPDSAPIRLDSCNGGRGREFLVRGLHPHRVRVQPRQAPRLAPGWPVAGDALAPRAGRLDLTRARERSIVWSEPRAAS
jgi:hypothetical protein